MSCIELPSKLPGMDTRTYTGALSSADDGWPLPELIHLFENSLKLLPTSVCLFIYNNYYTQCQLETNESDWNSTLVLYMQLTNNIDVGWQKLDVQWQTPALWQEWEPASAGLLLMATLHLIGSCWKFQAPKVAGCRHGYFLTTLSFSFGAFSCQLSSYLLIT